MNRDATLLADALWEPESTAALDADGWTALLTMARAELLIGTLAVRLRHLPVPDGVRAILDEASIQAEYQRRSALWEADSAARALAEYQGKIVLMKGAAYAAAGREAGQGRSIGDLDIMVGEGGLGDAEEMLLAAGWEWVKEDAYDDAYYRDHMHELPPLIHKERDRMIDVHHTILPRTARPKPDAAAMINDAVILQDRLYVFSPPDMVIHCAAHLLADGDLAGGMRNLWDYHCLVEEFGKRDGEFWQKLEERAGAQGLLPAVRRAAILAKHLYSTHIPTKWVRLPDMVDGLFIRRITARDGWGRKTRKFTRLAFYIRSHWLRMPPMMLARHLWTKWRGP